MARKKRKRPHGMGCVYQRSPGVWWVKWRENGRARYSGGFPTPELAEKVRDKIVSDIKAGRAGLPADPRGVPTLGALAKDWLERRKTTHRSAKADYYRWKNHWDPFVGNLRPAEVDAAKIRCFVEAKLRENLSSTTVRHCVRLLSTFFADLVERGLAPSNPVLALPRSTRRLIKPASDPHATPFIECPSDVKKVFLALREPVNIAFAVGAYAGLRTGEVLGLEWGDIDLATRRIHVRRQVSGGRIAPLKDDESRVVPIQSGLEPILVEWRLRTGGAGLVFPPKYGSRGGTTTRRATFMRPHTLARNLRRALNITGLKDLTWYQATRHTFASQWILAGGSMEKLQKVMGHSTINVTERYSHLRTDLFRESDYCLLNVDLRPSAEPVASIVNNAADAAVPAEKGTFGYGMVTEGATRRGRGRITG
ncbi:MAG: site-specific integrase [Deltaproteobacteria bacterium]|nr:site-specific integrase [Deltaproteobacteria bacterium]